MDDSARGANTHGLAFDFGTGSWEPTTVRWGRWDVWCALDEESAAITPLVFVLWFDNVSIVRRTSEPLKVAGLESWPVQTILQNWHLRLSELCRRCALAEQGAEADAVGLPELVSWAQSTRALAARVRFGDSIPRLMCASLSEIEKLAAWPATRFDTVPANHRDMARLMFNTDLWAIDTLRKRLKDLEIRLPLEDLFAVLLAPIRRDFPDLVPDLEALKQRAWRLSQRILPGQADALMVDVLNTLRSPFLPDGSLET